MFLSVLTNKPIVETEENHKNTQLKQSKEQMRQIENN